MGVVVFIPTADAIRRDSGRNHVHGWDIVVWSRKLPKRNKATERAQRFWRAWHTAAELLLCHSWPLPLLPVEQMKVKVTWHTTKWWPILGICALHLTYPRCTHTAVNTHTRSSGQPFMLRRPGSSWEFDALLQFLPARDSNSQPFEYESDSNIRQRLPQQRCFIIIPCAFVTCLIKRIKY